MNKPLDIELVMTGASSSTMLVVARVGPPDAPIDPRTIIGSVKSDEHGPDWSTFENNPPFSEWIRTYLQGDKGTPPEAIAGGRVQPGERFFVVDARAGGDEVAPHDVVGAYETDTSGAAVGATFRLNPNYRFIDLHGRMSSLLEEESLVTALRNLR